MKPRPFLTTWLGRGALALFVLVVAIFAGTQLAHTDKRVVQVLAAGLLVYMSFRSKLITGLMLAVLFLPFPKGTSYGSTNMAFMLMIFIVWIFRASTGRAQPPVRTPVDIPIVGLIMAYALSFYNVARPEFIPLAWIQYLRFLTYAFLMYLVANIVRTSEDVRKVFTAQCVSCLLVCLCALFEQARPGAAIVPGWIDFTTNYITGQGLRVGSTFLDYELFGEYCAINLILQMFMFVRAESATRKFAIVMLMLLTFYCLFSTVTRGAIITFMAGLVYLAWLSRNRLSFVRLTMGVGLAVALIGGGDFIVSHFSKSGSVLTRLFSSHLENGMPDTRAPAWAAVWEKVLQSPVIGHGPYYWLEKGLGLEWWPHNVYLFYAYITGFVGLTFFLWILRELWVSCPPKAASLGSGTYVQGATVLIRVMLFMFMLDQTKIDYLRNSTYPFFVWFLFGLILAVGKVARTEALALVGTAGSNVRKPDEARRADASDPPRRSVSAIPAVQAR